MLSNETGKQEATENSEGHFQNIPFSNGVGESRSLKQKRLRQLSTTTPCASPGCWSRMFGSTPQDANETWSLHTEPAGHLAASSIA